MSGNIRIEQVLSRRHLDDFIKVPWSIYREDKHWVPPLISEMKKILDRRRFPFFQHSHAEFFVAYEGTRPVGRIAAIHNSRHCEFHHDQTGFFGFFECLNRKDVAESLIETAAKWLRVRGLLAMRGPTSYSTNDTCGLLVEGFDSPPFVMMAHNPPYYAQLLEACGFQKAKDLLAFFITEESIRPDSASKGRFVLNTAPRTTDRPSSDVARDAVSPHEEQKKLAARLARRYQVTIRKADFAQFREEVDVIRQIYNGAWEQNWGFVPTNEAEFNYMAAEMRRIADPDLLLIGEVAGRPAAFVLALPNVNEALAKINGRLFPTGLFKLLWHSRKIRGLRVVTLGVVREHRRKGLDALLYLALIEQSIAKGYTHAELSWVLEDNVAMTRPIEALGARAYKRYRLYERELNPRQWPGWLGTSCPTGGEVEVQEV